MINKYLVCALCSLIFLLAACDEPAPTPDSQLPTVISPTPPAFTPTPLVETTFNQIIDQRTVGEYEILLWGDDSMLERKAANGYGRFTIERDGETLVIIEEANGFRRNAPIMDYTGDSIPDILLMLRNGGSHCCVGTVMIQLGDEPVELLRVWSSIDGDGGTGEFKDLNDDGVYEFITQDAIQAPCTTPSVKVILQYTPEDGFHPASPLFPEQYEELIELYTERAETEFARDGGVHQCSIPILASAYYFSGRPKEAKAVFDKYYTAENADTYWQELVEGFHNARFFTE